MIAISRHARARPDASASAAEAPLAVWLFVTLANTVPTAATASDPPTYRAMFEMPEAWPTSSGDTTEVEAAEAGPFDRPSPAAAITSGATSTA